MTDCCLILTTVPDEGIARVVTRRLVEDRLAACVSASSPVLSTYWWDDKIAEDREFVLVIKTRRDLFGAVEAAIRELHPYQVPEIIALPIEEGSSAYLGWILCETREPGKAR